MKLSTNAYLAGLGTAAIAIVAGFGGGVLIANRVDTHSATPAAGMSRIERTKREDVRTVLAAPVAPAPVEPAPIAETTGQASPNEDQTVNPLAEAPRARFAAADEAKVVEATPEKSPAEKPSPAVPIAIPTERKASDVALPAAIQSISSPASASPRRGRHARRDARPRVADEPNVAPTGNTREVSRRDRSRSDRSRNADSPREVARYREGGVRYVVRTENGRPANPAEVESLKQELRARRAGRIAETDTLSYAPTRRSGLMEIFRD